VTPDLLASFVNRRLRRRSCAVFPVTAVTVSVALAANLLTALPAAHAATAPPVSYTYDASGRLASVTTATGTATYHYDAEGNLLSISRSTAGPRTGAPRHAAAPAPKITSARPAVVVPGKTITIEGSGFSVTAVKNLVRVGSLMAPVTKASATRLTVNAPPGTGGRVVVTTPGGTARGPRVRISEPPAPVVPTPGRDPRPRRAPAGVTALSGLVETNTGHPLARVAISVASASGQKQAAATTNAGGQFLLAHLSPGRHQLIISGDAVGGPRQYGVYAEPVELPRGRTTVLPWVTYLTPLDLAHSVTVPSPATREVTLTTPKIPGLEIQVPKGTVIRDHDGHVVTKLSITPLTVGRTPYPLAPGMQPGFFTLQPGDATVSGPGLRVIYPNGTGQPPGTAIPYFIDSPDWAGTGWWRYGTGHVSANGKQLIPAPGVHWIRISLGGYGTNPPPPTGPPPGSCPAPGPTPTPTPNPQPGPAPGSGGSGSGGGDGSAGPPPSGPNACPADPVSLASGLLVDQSTDLSLADVEGVTLSRTFRQSDDTVRDFGIGMSSSLNFYVVASSGGDFDLYLPDGGEVTYAPTNTTGLYQAVGTPTAFVGSTMTWTSGDPDGPFTATLTDGTVLSFDNPAYLTRITDRFGNTIDINRTELTPGGGQINSVTTPDGLWLKFTYGTCVAASPSTTCITQVQDNSGRTVRYAYDASGRLTTVTNPAGGKAAYTWAACTGAMTCTELLNTTDPDGHVTSNVYDPATARITSQKDGAGGTWSFAYQTNSHGQITQTDVTDPRGIKDAYSFDASGYLSSVTDAAGTSAAQTTKAVFDPTTNLLTSQTDPLGRTTAYTYDSLGDVATVTELAGTAQAAKYSFTYEPAYHRLASVTDALGHTSTIAYNDAARTETVTDALGHKWVISLNDEGQPIEETDPLGGHTFLSYLYGDLVAVANPLGQAAGAYYDEVGDVLQSTDPEGNTTSYTWTPLGRLATQTSPAGGVTSYGYDADGNLTALTDADGHKTTFAYDADNNEIKTTDPLGNNYAFAYDADGNLSTVSDANGNKDTFTYNALDLLTAANYGVSGSTAQNTITYAYDAASRPIQVASTSSGTDKLTYDGLNDVLSESTPQGTVSHTYNAVGLPVSLSVPGQSTASYTYDADERLTGITQGSAQVTTAYDADSRPTAITLPDGITRTSTYDAASDLTALTFAHASTQVGAEDFGYTADGQIASESGSLASASLPAMVTANTYNADNELVKTGATGYSYDKNGNLTSSGADSLSWNAQNQLTGISGGTTVAFTYNPFGQQATAKVGTATTSYLYDGTAWDSNVVQEQSGSTPTANLLTGAPGQIFQLTTPSGTNDSLLAGPLGSTMALANSTGQITTSYTYDPSGTVTTTGAASPNTFEFNGTQNLGTGLYLTGARYYNPATGTFASQDPIGFNSGTTDLYGYANDDPVNQSDPTGCGCDGGPPSALAQLLPPPSELNGIIWGAIGIAAGSAAGWALATLAGLTAFPVLLASLAGAAVLGVIFTIASYMVGGMAEEMCKTS
jgi:RHS repeat-associated protein